MYHVRHVSYDGGHARPMERRADHDRRSTGARRQHGRYLGQSNHAGARMLVKQRAQLVDIGGTKRELLAEWKSLDADATPGRRHPTGLRSVVALALAVCHATAVVTVVIFHRHMDVESILPKYVRVFPERDLHGGRAVEWKRIEQRLRIQNGRALQILKAILLIRRMLIDDETAHTHRNK